MSQLRHTFRCPKCQGKITVPMISIYPSSTVTCTHCGVVITNDANSTDGRKLQADEDQRAVDKQRFRTLRFRILMTLLPFVLIAMFLTNPDEASLRAKVVTEGREHGGQTGAVLTEALLSTRYKNLHFFSVGGTAWSKDARHAPYLGLFGHWFPLTRAADHGP